MTHRRQHATIAVFPQAHQEEFALGQENDLMHCLVSENLQVWRKHHQRHCRLCHRQDLRLRQVLPQTCPREWQPLGSKPLTVLTWSTAVGVQPGSNLDGARVTHHRGPGSNPQSGGGLPGGGPPGGNPPSVPQQTPLQQTGGAGSSTSRMMGATSSTGQCLRLEVLGKSCSRS